MRANSPAIDAGVQIPVDWLDPFRKQDTGRPDIGALPRGVESSEIGPVGKGIGAGEDAEMQRREDTESETRRLGVGATGTRGGGRVRR